MEPVDASVQPSYERTDDEEEEAGDLNLKAKIQRLGTFGGRLKWLKRKQLGERTFLCVFRWGQPF
jgi:hypothetical protein